ncbi:unnamed protein product [Durusdinium trenchii]|uniref:C2H2-type domain-containing protein n=1 Tax=Durusdinium trenchii TaxID=1381693 RepID=A0ABP0R5Z2_9DINO
MAPKPTQKETENDKEKEKDSDAEAEESESDVPDGECAECGQVFNTPDEEKHEAIDVRHFTETKDSTFCDIYQDWEGKWMAIADYINEKVTDPAQKKKLRTHAQKKNYCEKAPW